MTWSTLPAYSDGNALTAAQVTAIKDNINESAPAKATTEGYWFIATGTNAIAERAIVGASVLSQQTRTSTSYGNLTTVGPDSGSITTGTKALVHIACQLFNSSTDSCWSSYSISGATTVSADDEWAIACQGDANDGFRFGQTKLHTGLTGGSNAWRQVYRVSGSTGTFDDRHIIVQAL